MRHLPAWARGRAAMMCREDGFAMIIVMVMLVIVLALGAAGLAESLDSQTSTARDARDRRAQQATDAGIQRVLYEEAESNIDNWNLNGGPLGLSSVVDCVPVTLNASAQISGLATASVNAAGVCPLTSTGSPSTYPEPLGDHAFETTEFIPGQTNFLGGAEREYLPKIVSLGWDDDGTNKVYARQEAILAPVAPLQAIEGMNNVTLNGLSALGLNVAVAVNGDVYARGTLTLPALYAGVNLSTSSGSILATVAAPTVSGSIVSTVNNGTVNKSQIVQRPPVTIASSKTDCPSGGCPSVTNKVGSDGYVAATHSFTMTNANESVTFQPGDYVFCNFNVTAGTVNVNPSSSAPVRIFVDSSTSSRCKNDGLGSAQGNFTAANGIANLLEPASPTGTTTAPSGLQIYVVGDGGGYDNATSVNIGDTATCTLKVLNVCTKLSTPLTQAAVIYAPTSSVTVNTGVCAIGLLGSCTLGAAGIFDGAVIGDNVSVTATTITQDLDLGNYPLYDGVNVFRVQQYIQCDSSLTSLSANPTTDTAGC